MIELFGISKCYGDTRAFAPFDITIHSGERVALVGPSGCGKTTVLRIIAGLETLDEGEVRIGGVAVGTRSRLLAPFERGIGYVPQSAGLFPTMSVRRNVAYGLHALPRHTRARRSDAVLEAFGLTDLADRAPHALSGGQARRVALARALAPEPARLLLDEPLTNLDAGSRAELLDEIDRAVGNSGASLLYVTHEPAEAERLGARIVTMPQ